MKKFCATFVVGQTLVETHVVYDDTLSVVSLATTVNSFLNVTDY